MKTPSKTDFAAVLSLAGTGMEEHPWAWEAGWDEYGSSYTELQERLVRVREWLAERKLI